MSANDVVISIDKIDFQWLAEQKQELVEAISNGAVSKNMDGLLNLLDSIQDYAVDEAGVSKEIVFPKLKASRKQKPVLWVVDEDFEQCGYKVPNQHDFDLVAEEIGERVNEDFVATFKSACDEIGIEKKI